MPKEYVVGQDHSGFRLRIGWSREPAGGVQVAVETPDGRPLIPLLWPDCPPAVLEKAPDFTNLWGDLDRDGCNQAIRLLRKARDQAYGPDA